MVPPEVVQAITNKKAQYCRLADIKQWDAWAGLGLPEATYSYHLSSGAVAFLQGRPTAFGSPAESADFFRAFFRRQQSLHNVSLAELAQTGPDEVQATWGFEDQLVRDYTFWTCRLRGGGYCYEETWQGRGDEWFIASLRMQRTYQVMTFGYVVLFVLANLGLAVFLIVGSLGLRIALSVVESRLDP